MALAHKKSILPAAEERRRFQRVKVHLLGRYMLPDRREFPCQIINMSPGGLALLAPGIGNVGDRVIAYLDHIGRVEGKITRIIDNGFAMTVGATARKRDKLAAQLTWLANRDILNLPEDRRHDRIVPRNPIALLTLEDGTKMTCRIIDMSLSGAAIAAENRPPLKSLVMLGKVQARVVRNLEEGFALEFVHPAARRDARRQRYRAVNRRAQASFAARRRFRQIFLRLRLALERRHLVGIDPHHQIVDVILDPGEPMTGAGRDHDDIASLDLISDAIAHLGAVVAGTVELDHRAHGRRRRCRLTMSGPSTSVAEPEST